MLCSNPINFVWSGCHNFWVDLGRVRQRLLTCCIVLTFAVLSSSVRGLEAVRIVVRPSRNSGLVLSVALSADKGAKRAIDGQGREVYSAKTRDLSVMVTEISKFYKEKRNQRTSP